jgi:hypothetical protein
MAKLNMKRTLNFNDLLDPNKGDAFTLIPADVWGALNNEAQTLLDTQETYLSAMADAQRKSNLGGKDVKFPENVGVPQYMIDHWKSIRKGVVPFGLKVEDVATGSERVKVEEEDAEPPTSE